MQESRKSSATRFDPSNLAFTRSLRNYSLSPRTGQTTKATTFTRMSVPRFSHRGPQSAAKLYSSQQSVMIDDPEDFSNEALTIYFDRYADKLLHNDPSVLDAIHQIVFDPNSLLKQHIAIEFGRISSRSRLGEYLIRKRAFWIVMLTYLQCIKNQPSKMEESVIDQFDRTLKATFRAAEVEEIYTDVSYLVANKQKTITEVEEPQSEMKEDRSKLKRVQFSLRKPESERQMNLKQWELKTQEELEIVQNENLQYIALSQGFEEQERSSKKRQNTQETMLSTVVSGSLEAAWHDEPVTQLPQYNEVDAIPHNQMTQPLSGAIIEEVRSPLKEPALVIEIQDSSSQLIDEGPRGVEERPIMVEDELLMRHTQSFEEMSPQAVIHGSSPTRIVDDVDRPSPMREPLTPNLEESVSRMAEPPLANLTSNLVLAQPSEITFVQASTPVRDQHLSPTLDELSLQPCIAATSFMAQEPITSPTQGTSAPVQVKIEQAEHEGFKKEVKQEPPADVSCEGSQIEASSMLANIPESLQDRELDSLPPFFNGYLKEEYLGEKAVPQLNQNSSDDRVQPPIQMKINTKEESKEDVQMGLHFKRTSQKRNTRASLSIKKDESNMKRESHSSKPRVSLDQERRFLETTNIPRKSQEENLGSGYQFQTMKASQAIKQSYGAERMVIPVRVSFRVQARQSQVEEPTEQVPAIFVDNDGVRESFEPVNVKQSVLDEKIQDGAISSSAIGFQKKRKRATAPVARQVAVFNDYNTYEFAGLKIQISGILDPKFDGKGLYQLVELTETTAKHLNTSGVRVALMQVRPRCVNDSEQDIREAFGKYSDLMKVRHGTEKILIMIYYGSGQV